jgi:hypothetical protein
MHFSITFNFKGHFMPDYVMNKNSQSNGDHEVHSTICNHKPDIENQLPLGWFTDCWSAVKKAKEIDPDADGCFHCSRDCHTS